MSMVHVTPLNLPHRHFQAVILFFHITHTTTTNVRSIYLASQRTSTSTTGQEKCIRYMHSCPLLQAPRLPDRTLDAEAWKESPFKINVCAPASTPPKYSITRQSQPKKLIVYLCEKAFELHEKTRKKKVKFQVNKKYIHCATPQPCVCTHWIKNHAWLGNMYCQSNSQIQQKRESVATKIAEWKFTLLFCVGENSKKWTCHTFLSWTWQEATWNST